MAYEPVDLVEVRAWGARVGVVGRDPSTRVLTFNYTGDWRQRGIEIAPLHMPTTGGPYAFPELSEDTDTFLGLPPMLADSLPDRFGNRLIDAWMADQGVARDDISALDRLAYMGTRGIGALEFQPTVNNGSAPTVVQLADLVVGARRLVSGEIGDDSVTLAALAQLIEVGTSAGGARAKAVVAYNPATGQLRSGQFDAPDGFTHWLLKLDGIDLDADAPDREQQPGRGFGRIEMAYHLMARDAGVEMTECHLLEENGRAHFMTRRFDRPAGGGKIHVVSLCALEHMDFNLPRVHSYAQYLQAIDALDLGPDAREQAFLRIVFNVAAVNRDDHTKNLAFLCDADGTWRLAPAYDVTHAHNSDGEWTAQHQMSVNGKFDGIGTDDLLALADRFAVPGARGAIDRVRDAVIRWEQHAEQAGAPDQGSARIRAELDSYGLPD
jgi:serine/threonine-protein kinase HipA